MRRIGTALVILLLVLVGAALVIGMHDLVELRGEGTPAPTGTPVGDRLARVADRKNLRLVHTGRSSGKPYEVTLWFAVDGDTLYLSTMDTSRQWVRNVAHTPRVELVIGAERFTGTVEPVTAEAEKRHEYGLLKEKYWVMRVMDAVLRLTGRDPGVSIDAGRGGYFRVRPDSAPAP